MSQWKGREIKSGSRTQKNLSKPHSLSWWRWQMTRTLSCLIKKKQEEGKTVWTSSPACSSCSEYVGGSGKAEKWRLSICSRSCNPCWGAPMASLKDPLTQCFCLGDRASLSSPGLPETHNTVQAALQLLIILLPQGSCTTVSRVPSVFSKLFGVWGCWEFDLKLVEARGATAC